MRNDDAEAALDDDRQTGSTMPIGTLSEQQVGSVLIAATAAPSLHNSQPWLFECTPASIKVRVDPSRTLDAADPDRRSMMLAGGAALLNLRVAMLAEGVTPLVFPLPNPGDPDLIAVVRPDGAYRPTPADRGLAAAIPRRHTNRHPFLPDAIPEQLVNSLRRAARTESSWLTAFTPAQLSGLRRLLTTAHHTQLDDPRFVTEWNAWTARAEPDLDGVPRRSSGPLPEPQDMWVLRDFSAGTARTRTPGKDFESDPLIVVVETFNDLRLAQLNAGQAMQRVLLTATAEGLATSFLSQVVEVPQTRTALRELTGGRLWPQIVLRLGYGSPTPPTPRRPLDEVVRTSTH